MKADDDAPALRDILYNLDSDEADIPFWEGCARGEFLVHRCNVCGRSYWPGVLCVEHGPRDMAWTAASGRGKVHVHVTMHHAYTPEMKGRVPYNVSVVELEEGPFFHTNVIDCAPDRVHSGMAVEVVFRPHSSGLTTPVFRPRKKKD